MSSKLQETLLAILKQQDKLIGIFMVHAENSFMMGLSWKTKDGNHYRNFYSSEPPYIDQNLKSLLQQQNSLWLQNISAWIRYPKSYLLLGRLR